MWVVAAQAVDLQSWADLPVLIVRWYQPLGHYVHKGQEASKHHVKSHKIRIAFELSYISQAAVEHKTQSETACTGHAGSIWRRVSKAHLACECSDEGCAAKAKGGLASCCAVHLLQLLQQEGSSHYDGFLGRGITLANLCINDTGMEYA